nr:inositol monophosphatase 1-like [Rhipicephalus microplus]
MVTDQDIERFFCKAFELVKEFGVVVQRAIGEGKQIEMKSEFTDLVTQYDRQVEQLLIGKLQEQYPNHKFIGEESVAAGIKSEFTNDPTWIIDPIDGDMNFVHGCHKRALKKGFQQVLARRTNNKRELDVISCNGMERYVDAQRLRCLGSTAVNMCFVASGEADAFYEFGMHVWDMAAAALIVTEAGGVVMDTQGGPLNLMHRRVLCASSHALASTISQILEHVQLESD